MFHSEKGDLRRTMPSRVKIACVAASAMLLLETSVVTAGDSWVSTIETSLTKDERERTNERVVDGIRLKVIRLWSE